MTELVPQSFLFPRHGHFIATSALATQRKAETGSPGSTSGSTGTTSILTSGSTGSGADAGRMDFTVSRDVGKATAGNLATILATLRSMFRSASTPYDSRSVPPLEGRRHVSFPMF